MQKNETVLRVILVLTSVFISLLAGELIVRDYRAGFKNLITEKGGNLVEHHFRGLYAYDPLLGWVPRSNVSIEKWDTTVSTLDDGIRSNGPQKTLNKNLRILVVGDSYAFGDEVADNETWPAQLELLTNYEVLNAGVSSFGFDQIILRAEELIPKYKPDIVILSLIYDDVERCAQYVRHGVPKPYFILKNGLLVVKNQPVPFIQGTRLDWFRQFFGYSHLFHKIMSRFFPSYWWAGTQNEDFRYLNNVREVPEIIELLLEKLARHRGTPQMIVFITGGIKVDEIEKDFIDLIIDKIQVRLPSLRIVNHIPTLIQLKRDNPDEFYKLYIKDSPYHHFSAHGNLSMATVLAEQINKELSGRGE
ncbi:MAG: hypothetical protein WC450_06815 [Candidatus Omnitrophota bacterium]